MRDNRYTNQELLELLLNDITLKNTKCRISKVNTLIIDEISMISADVFAQLEFICRSIRGNNTIFGGIQLIVCGDFRQLKPVPNDNYHDAGHYCFTSEAWQRAISHVVVLESVMRQREQLFIDAIQDLARGEVSQKTIDFLRKLSRPLEPGTEPMYLFSLNFDVEMANYDMLSRLEGPEKVYKSKTTGPSCYNNRFQAPKVLVLKVSCKVMLLANLNQKLVNGTLGTVVKMSDRECIINFEDVGPVCITPYLFTIYSRDRRCDAATREQLPLRLAYALTIHKAQGMSMSRLVVDANHANKPGQLATAVGRAISSNGLQLLHFNPLNVPRQPEAVEAFYQNQNGNHQACHCANHARSDDDDDGDDDVDDDDNDNGHNDDYDEDGGGGGGGCVGRSGTDGVVHDGDNDSGGDEGVEQSDRVDFDDKDDDGGDDDDDDNDDDDVLLRIMEDFEQNRVDLDETTPRYVIPINVDVLRQQVQSDFKDGETPEQQILKDKDSALRQNSVVDYLGHQWHCFEEWFHPLQTKGRGKLEHKDFMKFLKKCDQFLISQEHIDIVGTMCGHKVDMEDRRLAHKYFLKLQHTFLSFQESKSRSNVAIPSESNDVEIADVSKAAIRYLGGMCFAKYRYKLKCIAINNVHKSNERSLVMDARRSVALLDELIVTQGKRPSLA